MEMVYVYCLACSVYRRLVSSPVAMVAHNPVLLVVSLINHRVVLTVLFHGFRMLYLRISPWDLQAQVEGSV